MSAISEFLLKKDINAALVAFGCVMLTFVGIPGEILAAVIIALCTMMRGYKSGAVVLAFVALPGFAFLLHREISPFDFVFIQCVFVWLLAGLVQKLQSWRLVFEIMALVGVALVALFHAIVPDTTQFWLSAITKVMTTVNTNLSANLDVNQLVDAMRPMAPYMTGLLLFSVSSLIFVELLLARRWQLRLQGRPEAFRQEFVSIHMGYVGAACLSLLLVGSYLQLPVARDSIFVFILPFMMSGLSYLHFMLKRYRQLIYLMIALYIGLFISVTSIKIVLLLALIGYVDSFCDFRKRFAL